MKGLPKRGKTKSRGYEERKDGDPGSKWVACIPPPPSTLGLIVTLTLYSTHLLPSSPTVTCHLISADLCVVFSVFIETCLGVLYGSINTALTINLEYSISVLSSICVLLTLQCAYRALKYQLILPILPCKRTHPCIYHILTVLSVLNSLLWYCRLRTVDSVASKPLFELAEMSPKGREVNAVKLKAYFKKHGLCFFY